MCFKNNATRLFFVMSKKAIQIDAKDNVATTTSIVEAGDKVEVLSPNGDVILVTEPVEEIPARFDVRQRRQAAQVLAQAPGSHGTQPG